MVYGNKKNSYLSFDSLSCYFICTLHHNTDVLLQNIVGIGAGIADGLGYGDNTKAAVIRLGLMEMIKFSEIFIPGLFICLVLNKASSFRTFL